MTVTQAHTVINSLVKQALGQEALTVVNAADLVSIGDKVLKSDVDKDRMYNTLFDRITKTILSNRVYNADISQLVRHPFEFGAVLQKIFVDLSDAVKSEQWNLVEGESIDQFVIQKQAVHQKLFTDLSIWEVDYTISDEILKTAFTDEQNFSAFMNGLHTAAESSIELQKERSASACMTNFIAEKIKHFETKGGMGVYNLLANYNSDMGKSVTAAQAYFDADFLRYAVRKINLIMGRMTNISTLFNDELYKRHTPTADMRVSLLTEFTESAKVMMQSDTFNKELVSLPRFAPVEYWQATGSTFALNDVSAINVVPVSGGDAKNYAGIVGVISDYEALGVTIERQRERTAYNAKGEYTNYFKKLETRYFNDMSENGIVLMIS